MTGNNKGKPWSADHVNVLRQYAADGWNANQLAYKLKRTEYAITCQAENLGIRIQSQSPVPQTPTITPVEAPIMTTHSVSINRTVNTITRIGNVDADKFGVDELLTIIEEQEAFVARLKKLGKSPTINALTKKHFDNIRELTKVLEDAIEREEI